MTKEAAYQLTPEVYRKFVEESQEYPLDFVDRIEDTARFISSRIQFFFIFNSISSIVAHNCLAEEHEYLGNPNEARAARLRAIDEQRAIADTLLGDERLQAWYREVEGKIEGLLTSTREVLPDHFYKTAPLLIGHVRRWADAFRPI